MAQIKLKNNYILHIPGIRDFAVSLVLFVVSRASVLGMFPFGAAFFAACADKSTAYLSIAAVCGGLAAAGAGIKLLHYLIALLLYCLYSRFEHFESKIINATACGVCVFTGGVIFLFYSYSGLYDIMLCAAEAIISAIMYIVFMRAGEFFCSRRGRTSISQDEIISVAVCAGVCITGLSGINLPPGMTLSGIAAVYAVMCITDCCSLGASGSGGMCIGFMCGMSGNYAVASAGFYGLCAVFGNLLKTFGRLGTTIGFLGGAAAAMIYTQYSANAGVHAADIVMGALLFTATPKSVHEKMSAFFSKTLHIDALDSQERIRFYLSSRLENAAKSFTMLAENFRTLSDKRLNNYVPAAVDIFDDTARRVCGECPMQERCYDRRFGQTYKILIELLHEAEKGRLNIKKIPVQFRDKCMRPEVYVNEFLHVFEVYRVHELFKGEAVRSRNISVMQYNDMADMFTTLSHDAHDGIKFRTDYEDLLVTELDKCGVLLFEISVVETEGGKTEVYLGLNSKSDIEKIEQVIFDVTGVHTEFHSETDGIARFISKTAVRAEISMCGVPVQTSDISGDTFEVFEIGDYTTCVILSDGMGCGADAAAQSRATVRLLKSFLEAGFDAQTALRMINSSMCLNLDKEETAAIDMLCIDKVTAAAQLFKTGSAESIIVHEGKCETVFPASLPAGILTEINIAPRVFRVSNGDMLILATDGVTQSGGGIYSEWVKKIIKADMSAEENARKILNTALERSDETAFDDMSVAVIKINCI